MVIADAMIASRVADLSLYVIREGMLDKRQLPDVVISIKYVKRCAYT